MYLVTIAYYTFWSTSEYVRKNRNLKWERTKGIDMGLILLCLTTALLVILIIIIIKQGTYYSVWQYRYNRVYYVQNQLGEIHNTGWEVGLTGNIIRNENFKWDIKIKYLAKYQ